METVYGRPAGEIGDCQLVTFALEMVNAAADPAGPGQQQRTMAAPNGKTIVVDGIEEVHAGPLHLEEVGTLFGDDGSTVAVRNFE